MITIRRAEVDGRVVDVRLVGDRIETIGERLPTRAGATDVDAAGGALIPGLHDHHLHLLAAAAAERSVVVDGRDAIDNAHRRLPPGRWLRGVGYHEAVSGPLDRWVLDRMAPGRPVRVQHRSGAMWVLSSTAVEHTSLDRFRHAGVERDDHDRPTGRLFGLHRWLGDRVPRERPDLGPIGRRLLTYGVTGVTDTTPTDRLDDLIPMSEAVVDGSLPQRVMITGGPDLPPETPPGLVRGPAKLVVADHDLPNVGELVAGLRAARRQDRAVAVHCVTRVALVLALAAWEEVGARSGDRIEHGGVVPHELMTVVAGLGLSVVTQPGFVAERGDQYLTEVDPEDRPHLYPCASLLRAGVPVAASTDAPFGALDPWAAIVAAVRRTTASGRVLGADERVAPRRALDLFLGPAGAPGGPPRRVVVGAAADLCLLDAPLVEALADPSADHVVATMCAGKLFSQ